MPLTSFTLEYVQPGTTLRMCKGGCGGRRIEVGQLKLRVERTAEQTTKTAGTGAKSSKGGKAAEVVVQLLHWECATQEVLSQIKVAGVRSLVGLDKLRDEDQIRVAADVDRGFFLPPPTPPPSSTTSSSRRLPTVAPTPAVKAAKRPRETRPIPSSSPQIVASSSSHTNSRIAPSRSTQAQLAQRVSEGEDDASGEEEEEEVCVRVTMSQVVGIQHYRGLVGEGEQVALVREPHNPYDRNAVQVKNVRNVQVGHLPATMVSRLARLMDIGLVRVEGEMTQGNLSGNPYKLGIRLNMFARESVRDTAEAELAWTPTIAAPRAPPPLPGQTNIHGITSPKKGKGKEKEVYGSVEPGETAAQAVRRQQELENVLGAFKKVGNDEMRGEEVLDTLTDLTDVLDLPLHPNPPGRTTTGELTVDLMPYQSQGLAFMLKAENPQLPNSEKSAPVQLVQYQARKGQPGIYYNIAAKSPSTTKPVLGRGGMLADEMGLGKTIQMIALCVATLRTIPPGFEKSTLIVAPVSVLSNWTKQLEDHCRQGLLSVHIYHADGRNISAQELAKKDIVLTSYSTLSGELGVDTKTTAKGKKVKGEDQSDYEVSKKRKGKNGKLLGIKWKRIILDEGHTIKNPKARMTKATYALEAHSRWVVSGTPIVNSAADLGSLLSFLRVCHPLTESDYFKRLVLRPLAQGNGGAVRILKAVMNSICLRRTKAMRDKAGKPLVSLPELSFFVTEVNLTPADRQIYDDIAAESQRQVEEYFDKRRHDGSTEVPTYANVLSLLTRMRQLALHSQLLPPNYLAGLKERPKEAGVAMSRVSDEDKKKLQVVLRSAVDDAAECPICLETMISPRILPCAHIFCFECIMGVLAVNPLCPMDRRAIDATSMFEVEALPESDGDSDEHQEQMDGIASHEELSSSAKVDALIKMLKLVDPTSKSLVFSQFTSFLSLIEPHLTRAGIHFMRFDGSMPVKKRDEIIRTFSRPFTGAPSAANPQVLLISLKSGSLGLNLTVASNVFLMDPWWQSGIEKQAIDRVFRIGQTKPVSVFQLVAAQTVESKVLEIQARKQDLIAQAFSGTKNAHTAVERKQARLEDLRELFAVSEVAAGQQ